MISNTNTGIIAWVIENIHIKLRDAITPHALISTVF